KRTGSGTTAQTSGCVSSRSGTRSTVAASGRAPRCAKPCSIRGRRSASRPMRRQGSHSPQKSSRSRWQLAACANMRASVNFPIPRGPEKSMACGTRSPASMPRSAVTVRSFPMNSEKLTKVSRDSLCGWRTGKNARFHDMEHRPMDLLRRKQSAGYRVRTVDACPVRFGCQAVVKQRSLLEMGDVRFMDIVPKRSVGTRSLHPDQEVRLHRWYAQIHDQVFDRQAVKTIFEVFQPGDKLITVFGGHALGLMGEIRANIAIGE